jgi:hypothetical protein
MTFEIYTCDKCGPAVMANYLVKLVSGELAFCGHHFRKYQEALDSVSYEVIELNKSEEVPQLETAE